MNRTALQTRLQTGGWLAGMAALVLITSSCYVTDDSGPLEHESHSVDLKGAKNVEVHVEMGAGELVMRGGEAKLMDAEFQYRSHDGKPDIQYDVNGTRGVLRVTQQKGHSMGNSGKNHWELRMNQDVPMDVSVKMGAGDGTLNLGNTALHDLDVEVGAGDMKVDLTGHPRGNMDVNVRGGVGQATVRLPKRARLDIEAHGGIGEISASGLTKRGDRWVNEPTGDVTSTIHVSVKGGIGQINLICE